MKTEQKKREFVSQRAEGNSFDKIAKAIKVSKPILIEWEREYKEDIANMKAEAWEVFMQEQKLTQRNRLELLSTAKEKLWAEFSGRSLSELQAHKLLELILKLDSSITEAMPSVTYFTESEIKTRRSEDSWASIY
ncbi:MAG: hypothetical protein FJ333_09165 [Sphingomonadales bacterium]|nr:hypothetical protein [Sphingomonadales bacterium]